MALYPTTVNFGATSFQDNRPTLLNQTLSGSRSVRQIGGQYFSFTVQMPPMTQENAQAYFAFLQKQKGRFTHFTITAPLDNLGGSRLETDIKVVGSQAVGDTSIEVDGLTNNQAGAFKAGDVIKFNDHDKVYMIQSDMDATGTSATILISPPLISTLADNEVVVTNKPQYTVYLANDEIMYTTDSSGMFNISFDVRERIT
jgi:hypothetical protein